MTYDTEPEYYTEEDLFGDESDGVPMIQIHRWQSQVCGDRCFFIYAFMNPEVGSDLLIRKTHHGEVFFSIQDEEYQAAGVNRVSILHWLIESALILMPNFETFWSAMPHEIELPVPEGWKLVIS